ncbi:MULTISPECIES: WXG100 family type VII secretion target [Streptomyces]|uniref:ESAT-6-like protein n=2 Tax=Streptomyces TaxID=1883 RepID=A0A286DU34_9ACTN|nr:MULTISPECIES: WXG100 family type VII secretion target [Streptomyces]TNM32737.1 WXG100 family type VII secretion target [Streptomyces sedi]SOD62172.1 WXG100 family type VII secretion target [Streptomyces zhaozhouensis]
MADGDIDVTYQDMHDAADHLLEAKDEILAKLQTLRTYIQDLVRDGYVTSASSIAFDQSYDEFNTGAREAVEALQGMADFLDGAADGYADLDRQLEEGLRE